MTTQTHITPWEWNAYGKGLIAQGPDGTFIRVKDSENRYFNPDFEAALAKGEVLKPALKRLVKMTQEEAEQFVMLSIEDIVTVDVFNVTTNGVICKVRIKQERGGYSKILNRAYAFNQLSPEQYQWCLINRYDVYDRIEQELAVDEETVKAHVPVSPIKDGAFNGPIIQDISIDELALYNAPKVMKLVHKIPMEEDIAIRALAAFNKMEVEDLEIKCGLTEVQQEHFRFLLESYPNPIMAYASDVLEQNIVDKDEWRKSVKKSMDQYFESQKIDWATWIPDSIPQYMHDSWLEIPVEKREAAFMEWVLTQTTN